MARPVPVVPGSLILVLLATPTPAQLARADEPRRDRSGDPLPTGAVLRLGTQRLRDIDTVRQVAFSPDGKVIASLGGRVCLWDATDHRLLRTLRLSTDPVAVDRRCLAFAPRDRYLAVGGDKLRLWDWQTGKLVWERDPNEGKVETGQGVIDAVAFFPDGKRLVTLSRYLTIWDTRTGKVLQEVPVPRGGASHTGLAVAPDGQRIATSGEGRLHVWELGANLTSRELPAAGRTYAGEVAFLPDSRTLVAHESRELGGKGLHFVCLWDTKQEKARTLVEDEDPVNGAALSADGKTLAVTRPAKIQFLDVATGRTTRELTRPRPVGEFSPSALALSRDGARLAAAGIVHRIQLWNVSTGQYLTDAAGHESQVAQVCHSPDGRLIATGGEDGVLLIWDAVTGAVRRRIVTGPAPYHAVTGLAFASDGRTLAAAISTEEPAGVCRSWEIATGREMHSHRLQGTAGLLAFAPDGRSLAASHGGTVKLEIVGPHERIAPPGAQVFDLPGFGPRLSITGKDWQLGSPVVLWRHLALRFSPDGDRFAAVCPDRAVRSWDARTGRETVLAQWDGTNDQSTAALFGDLSTAVIGDDSEGELIRFLALPGGEEWHRLRIPTEHSYVLAVSPDDRLLVAAVDGYYVFGSEHDDALHVFEVASGKKLATFHGGGVRAVSLAFAADGRRFTSGMEDGTALVWDVGPVAPARPVTEKDLQAWWDDLGSADAGKGYAAVRRLAGCPAEAVAFLDRRLTPAVAGGAETLRKLLADLDSDRFARRQQAAKELAAQSDRLFPGLRVATTEAKSPEVQQRLGPIVKSGWLVRDPELLRRLRAVQALEMIGTDEARRVLLRLAEGDPADRVTADARRGFHRLQARAAWQSTSGGRP